MIIAVIIMGGVFLLIGGLTLIPIILIMFLFLKQRVNNFQERVKNILMFPIRLPIKIIRKVG